MGKAEGIEVGMSDKAAWDEAMSRFGQSRKAVPKKPSSVASLSLHAQRLLPPDDKVSRSQE